MLDYADATAQVGELRYDTRREQIPQLELRLASARRLQRKDAEANAWGSLGTAYAAWATSAVLLNTTISNLP